MDWLSAPGSPFPMITAQHHSTGAAGVQNTYSRGSAGVRQENRTVTAGILQGCGRDAEGFSRGTVEVQLRYS